MNGQLVRARLRQVFPGAFLLTKRCRCTVHVFGEGPDAQVGVAPCSRCRRYARYRPLQGRA